MCGIVGFIENPSYLRDFETMERCLDSLMHRGPDFRNQRKFDNFRFGHTRLATIDQSNLSNQPICDISNSFILVFNGEIYNYLELRSQLIDLGYSFQSLGDAEVVLNSYKEWGKECLLKFEGQFAFSIYDRHKKIVFLARDIFGQKPLYYSLLDGFSFSSELTSFKVLCRGLKRNMVAMNHFLAIGYVLHPQTIYEEVYLLPPAAYLTYDCSTEALYIEQYYDYARCFKSKIKLNIKQVVEQSSQLITKAITLTSRGDVPFGVFLSGGLDSSIVIAELNKANVNVPAFNIAFGNGVYDESYKARTICKIFDMDFFQKDLGSIDLYDFNNYLEKIDYTTFDNSSYPLFKLAQEAKIRVKYVLGGDGADEIFGGYPTYRANRYNQLLTLIIPFLKTSNFKKLVDVLTSIRNDKVGFSTKLNRFAHGLDSDYRLAHYNWRKLFSIQERIAILGEKYKDLIIDSDPLKSFLGFFSEVEHLDRLDQYLYVDSKTWLCDNILIKLDRNSMFAGLEMRSPFLNRELTEFIASCPVEFKKDKKILKILAEGLLPGRIINNQKTGFNSPVSKWFNSNERDEFKFYAKYIYNNKYKE